MSSNKEVQIDGRPVAIITGGYQGIGKAIAIGLSGMNHNIVIADVLPEPGNLRKTIEANGVSFLGINADIARLEEHERIVTKTVERFGRIDLLVNNAGVAPFERKDVLETTSESFDRVLSINLRGAFFLTQTVAKQMMECSSKVENFYPRIVFISSISAEISSTNRSEYCISKAGLSMVSKLFADRLATEGINVYEIRPGIIRTGMIEPVKEKYDRRIKGGLIPQGRWGYPEDVAKTVSALVKGYLDFSTGAVIEVSGGMNIRRL